MAGDGGQSVD